MAGYRLRGIGFRQTYPDGRDVYFVAREVHQAYRDEVKRIVAERNLVYAGKSQDGLYLMYTVPKDEVIALYLEPETDEQDGPNPETVEPAAPDPADDSALGDSEPAGSDGPGEAADPS